MLFSKAGSSSSSAGADNRVCRADDIWGAFCGEMAGPSECAIV